MKHERLAMLPDWPRLMDADTAALYLGISRSLFLDRVKRKVYPAALREEDDSRVAWDRCAIDATLDLRSGLQQSRAPAAREIDTWADL
jgi:hypothetical protein